MASAIKRAVGGLFAEAKKTTSAMRKLLNPSVDETFAGSRVYPTRNNKTDAAYGIRFDRGPLVTGQPHVVTMTLQINSNAQEKSLQELMRKHGPHRKYVTVEVDTTQDATEENLDKLQAEVESKINELDNL